MHSRDQMGAACQVTGPGYARKVSNLIVSGHCAFGCTEPKYAHVELLHGLVQKTD
jgi:hypothetical protein